MMVSKFLPGMIRGEIVGGPNPVHSVKHLGALQTARNAGYWQDFDLDEMSTTGLGFLWPLRLINQRY